MFQKTIKKIVKFKGVGIHTGKEAAVSLIPLPTGSGLIFEKNNTEFLLNIKNIFSTSRSISIGDKDNNILTIEHLIAAVYMNEITNLRIKVDGPEIPILDGSSLEFVKIIESAGVLRQSKKINKIKIKEIIKIEDKDRFVYVEPSKKFGITYTIDFNHPDLHNQKIEFKDINKKIFKKDIAPARTFGFLAEVEDLRRRGLAAAGSIENAVVLTDTGYANDNIRFKDECVRHKVLDLIGAISIIGKYVEGHFTAYKSGHFLDFELIKKIVSSISKD